MQAWKDWLLCICCTLASLCFEDNSHGNQIRQARDSGRNGTCELVVAEIAASRGARERGREAEPRGEFRVREKEDAQNRVE